MENKQYCKNWRSKNKEKYNSYMSDYMKKKRNKDVNTEISMQDKTK